LSGRFETCLPSANRNEKERYKHKAYRRDGVFIRHCEILTMMVTELRNNSQARTKREKRRSGVELRRLLLELGILTAEVDLEFYAKFLRFIVELIQRNRLG